MPPKISHLFLVLCLGFIARFTQAQPAIPALKRQLARATADTSRSRLLYDLGKHYTEQNADSCLYLPLRFLQSCPKEGWLRRNKATDPDSSVSVERLPKTE